MSRVFINCRKCRQRIKAENTKEGYCYKERSRFGKDKEGKLKIFCEVYLNCGNLRNMI